MTKLGGERCVWQCQSLSTHRVAGRYLPELADQGCPPRCLRTEPEGWPSAGDGSNEPEEAEAMDRVGKHEGVHGDHAFRLQLAEWHVNGPLIRAGGVEAIEGKVGCFTNAHASVSEQQEDIGGEIVAAEQFLLEELILLQW